MPFTNETEYPKGVESSALGVTFQPTLGSSQTNSAMAKVKVSSMVFANSAGVAVTITVQGFGGGALLQTIVVPPTDTVEIERGFESQIGIEFVAGAGTAFVSIMYFDA